MPGDWRQLGAGRVARLCTYDLASGAGTVVFETDEAVIEAPNWSPDGSTIVFNREGLLYRLPADGSAAPAVVDSTPVRDANNDHVISPDGRFIYISSGDGHLYQVPAGGGAPRKVSNDHSEPFRYFLHGISPDGRTLAYTGAQPANGNPLGLLNIFTVPVADGDDVQLTHSDKPSDGPEYGPDGEWIYFNSEIGSERPGHAQIFRIRPDGTELTRLTGDERVNWFPHLAPDGSRLVYLSYGPGTTGHPADRQVLIRAMAPEGGKAEDLVALTGGQGTINVNSWAPDGRRFAYVEYPLR